MRKHLKLLTIVGVIPLIISSCGKGSAKSRSFETTSSEPSSSASSSSLPKTYTITWKNYNGAVLETDTNVVEGTTPTYDGITPVRNTDAQYSYVWSGWTPEVKPATADIEYTATFVSEIRKYTVAWKNEDGTVLKTYDDAPYGAEPKYVGDTPTKESTAEFSYTFDGWTPEVTTVTGNQTYTAKFKEERRKYKVTWKNHNGDVIYSEDVLYGETPSYGGVTPSKESTESANFIFDGWTPNISAVTGEITYTASFREETKKFVITWKNYDGAILKEEEVPYGETPSYSESTPKRKGHGLEYTFNGWDPALAPVTGNQTYTATYLAGEYEFTYDRIEYDLKEGVQESDIQGKPWINANYEGQMAKIEKPAFKDDVYTNINYEKIINEDPVPEEIAKSTLAQFFKDMASGAISSTNSDFIRTFLNQLSLGDVTTVSDYFANFDLDRYLSSKEVFGSISSYFDLVPNDAGDGYLINLNDGYLDGDEGINTLWFYSVYDSWKDYEQLFEPMSNIIEDAFNFSVGEDELDDVISAERYLSVSAINSSNSGDKVTLYQVDTIPWAPLKSALLDIGLKLTDQVGIRNYFINSINFLFNTYYAEYPEIMAKAVKIKQGFDYRFFMGLDGYRALDQLMTQTEFFRYEKNLYLEDDEVVLRNMPRFIIPLFLEQAYVETQCDEKVKNDVAKLINDILDGYKELMQTYDWLTNTSKTNIATKLNKMQFRSCFSEYLTIFDKVEDPDLENLSLFNLYSLYVNEIRNQIIKCSVGDIFTWWWRTLPCYIVNAFYMASRNGFVILNGIIPGFWSDEIEVLYANLGTVIGHEITHAFDAKGSYYDGDGNYKDILSKADRHEYNEKVKKMAAFYSQMQYFNDTNINGDVVNTEATADMGGMRVVLHLAKKIPEFDYDKFFKAYALSWCSHPLKEQDIPYAIVNEHPLNYLRVNTVLPQFDEFNELYGIEPGDGMYIPESERVTIW